MARFHQLLRVVCFTLSCLVAFCSGASAQFETRGSISAPFGKSAAVGDFDRDGKMDVAIAGTDLQIFLGKGDGTFQPPINYLIGTGAIFVAAADFNHDGILDLAVADLNGLFILMGNGDGTFQTPTTVPTLCIPTFVAVADFNGDHKADLLVTYSDCAYVSIFFGNGDGTFQQTPINTVPSVSLAATGIGDFNGDGKLDLALAEGFGTISQVEIMLGNGDGTFTPGATYKVGAEPESVAVADFRGNGKLDLAVASLLGFTEELLGNGDGTFKIVSTSPTLGAAWVIAADLNGDGKPDLAVAQLGNPGGANHPMPTGVAVIINNGDGTFQPPVYYPAGGEPRFVVAGDFNGDHKLDLLDSYYERDQAIVLLNTGVVSLSPTTALQYSPQLIGTASPRQTVTLTNTGTSALTISSIVATGPFRESNTCGKIVAAGAECKIEVSFQSQTIGDAFGSISISDSASSRPQVIALRAEGTTANISPLKLSFAAQSVHTKSAPQNVTLANGGTTVLNVTRFVVDGIDVQDFAETNNCPASLNPGANCIVAVTFDPAKKGTRRATLYIFDDGGGSPQVIPFTGTGD